ncbi:hypothetical protein NA32_09785 [Streptococcus hongkongensis]|nr:hypothetical protein NA32_09785 [Streptococcus hongkongensis]
MTNPEICEATLVYSPSGWGDMDYCFLFAARYTPLPVVGAAEITDEQTGIRKRDCHRFFQTHELWRLSVPGSTAGLPAPAVQPATP